jgi:hypothetical protein
MSEQPTIEQTVRRQVDDTVRRLIEAGHAADRAAERERAMRPLRESADRLGRSVEALSAAVGAAASRPEPAPAAPTNLSPGEQRFADSIRFPGAAPAGPAAAAGPGPVGGATSDGVARFAASLKMP